MKPIAFIIAALLCVTASAATINTTPGGVSNAAASATSGDVIYVADGTTSGGLNLTGKSGLTVQAINKGKWIIDGGQVVTGSNTLRGCVIQNAHTPWWDGALLPGNDSTVEDVTVRDNETIGICLRQVRNVTLRRVRSTHNGTLGLNSGVNGDNWCENITLEDVEVDNNNYGMVNMPGGQANKVYRASNGLWYRESFDEGGGVKITRTRGVNKVIRGNFHHNGGPGLWFDVQGNDWEVTGAEAGYNHNTPDRNSYEGAGFATEIGERVKFVNCYGHHNTGSAFAMWESPFTQLINCVCDQTGVEFRDITTRGGWRIHDILVDGMRCYNGTRVQQYPAPNMVVRNTQSLTGAPQWSAGSVTPPVIVTPPLPSGPESPNMSVTGPGASIIDAAGAAWSLTATGQIARNGVVQPGTSGVTELRYVNHVLYQRATALNWFWKWTGTGWQVTTDPGAVVPIPPPATQPDDTAALKAKIAALEIEVARLNAKLAEAHAITAP